MVVDNVSDKPYEKRQKTVEMNLSSKYTKNFFKTSPVSTHKHLPNVMPTSSPFVDLTNKVNNLIQPKLEPTKSIYSPNVQQTCNDENLLTLASLAVERSDGFKTTEAPTKLPPTKNDFIHTASDCTTDEEIDEETENEIIDLEHKDNVIAANTYLKGLVGQVFKASTGKKMHTSTG